ncbi:MAG TPA: 1-phosphofructokinase [Dehalococcoidia bacterium]|nr:1-phosphofructokinase [Dehalococcoidia bacterium]
MIATLTLNPSLDKTVAVKGMVVGDVNRWKSYRRDPGGKGINVSRALHNLGYDTVAYGFVGGHDGRILEDLLRAEGVRYDFTPTANEIRSNFIITDLKTGAQTRLNGPGPVIGKQELEQLRQKIRGIEPAPRFLVLAGSVPPRVPTDIYAQIIQEAKARGIRTALDSDEEWLRLGLQAKPDFIKPNLRETEGLLGIRLTSEGDIVEALRRLLAMGIHMAAISMGREGLIAARGDQMVKAIPPQVPVRSTVGAGDSAVAGFLISMMESKPLAEACRLACAAGAATVLTPGNQMCLLEDVQELLPLVRVEEIAP